MGRRFYNWKKLQQHLSYNYFTFLGYFYVCLFGIFVLIGSLGLTSIFHTPLALKPTNQHNIGLSPLSLSDQLGLPNPVATREIMAWNMTYLCSKPHYKLKLSTVLLTLLELQLFKSLLQRNFIRKIQRMQLLETCWPSFISDDDYETSNSEK